MKLNISYQNRVAYLVTILLFFTIYLLTYQRIKESLLFKLEKLQIYHSDGNEYMQDVVDRGRNKTDDKIYKCLIVIWTKFFGEKLETDGKNCPKTNCVFSYDKNTVSKADAVLFHGVDFNINDVPSNRTPEQIYIWFNLEAPTTHPTSVGHIKPLLNKNEAGSKGFFNWTFTYNSQSDVTAPYGHVIPKKKGTVSTDSWRNSTKTKKLAAWFVSNCNTNSEREIYIRELKKHIPITKCGGCNHQKCPPRGIEGMKYVAQNYHFYLSFENSKCKDYITEKAWVPLKTGVIPVVYGGSNYTHHLPPDSFIDAGKLTPEQLAQLLKRLAKSPSELAKFHEWRAKFEIDTHRNWCGICTRLQQHKKNKEPPKVIENLVSWWSHVNDCQPGYSKSKKKH